MKDEVRVVGVGGSLSPTSTSRAALRIAMEAAAAAGAETETFDVREMDLPFYSPQLHSTPPEDASRLAEAVCAAHGLIWSTPMYHGTVSGSFKNALDWLQLLVDKDPPFLTHKVVGLISVAGGVQGLQAVNTMDFAVRALRGWAVPLVMPIAQAWKVFEDGEAQDESVDRQLRALGAEVVRAAQQFAREGTCDWAPPDFQKSGGSATRSSG